QHPDRGRLARAVRPEHPEHRTHRYFQVDVVDRDRVAVHLARPPRARAQRRSGRGLSGRARPSCSSESHFTCPSASTSTCSGTAPIATRPSSVTIAVATLVLKTYPFRFGYETCLPNCLSRAVMSMFLPRPLPLPLPPI